jgi:hypothetical protein
MREVFKIRGSKMARSLRVRLSKAKASKNGKQNDNFNKIVPEEAREKFRESREKSKGSLNAMHDGVLIGLHAMDKGWKKLRGWEVVKRLNVICEVAKEEMVCVKDGGKCDNEHGVTLKTFNSYWSSLKKAVIYNTSLTVAKQYNFAHLGMAKQIANASAEKRAIFNDLQNRALSLYIKETKKGDFDPKNSLEYAAKSLKIATKELGKKNLQLEIEIDNGRSEDSEESSTWSLPDPDSKNDRDKIPQDAVDSIYYYLIGSSFVKLMKEQERPNSKIAKAIASVVKTLEPVTTDLKKAVADLKEAVA